MGLITYLTLSTEPIVLHLYFTHDTNGVHALCLLPPASSEQGYFGQQDYVMGYL